MHIRFNVCISLSAVIWSTAFSRSLPAAQAMSAQRCARISAAVNGLNYHRQASDFPEKENVWRFERGGTLQIWAMPETGKPGNGKKTDWHWKFEFEDQRCVLKIAATEQPTRWLSFRLRDLTWAIVDIAKWKGSSRPEERHIPDFEDHSGVQTRFCGMGDRCDKLWR